MDNITNDSKRVLLVLYKQYLERRKAGQSRSDASYFGDSENLQMELFKNDSVDDLSDYCWELSSAGYITCSPGDDLANNVTLTAETIIAMEQRFPNGVKQVLEALSGLIGIASAFI